MAFVDILISQLFVTGFAGLIIASMAVRSYFLYKRGRKHYRSLKGASIPLAALGFYIIISGFYGQFVWPLPGSYNILFYDIFTLAGILFVSFAFAVRSDIDTQPIGFFALLLGLMTIYYGYQGYHLSLTQIPGVLLTLYTLFGLTGIMAYPMTLLLDKIDLGHKINDGVWPVFAVAFLFILILASSLALGLAIVSVPTQLAMAP